MSTLTPFLSGRLRVTRSSQPELLDGDVLDPSELRANLRELAMLNRLPGGTAASIAGIERLARGRRQLSVIDVGTGAGDLPLAFARHGRRRGRWTVTGIDVRPEMLECARRRTGRDADVTLQLADGARLPFPDGSFDIGHCSLLLHHLDPEGAVRGLREMGRVSRLGVVVNDLQRGPLHLAVTSLTVLALGRSRYTRHDGILSARRAYTLAERHALLRTAGLAPYWESFRLAPRVATAAVPAEAA